MTQFDLRARFDDVAATVQPGPVRPTMDIEVEARRLRRARRTRWGAVVAAAAAAAFVVGAPVLLGGSDRDVSPSPEPVAPVSTPAEEGPCTRTAATGDQNTRLLLVEPDCSTTPVPLEGVAGISYTSLSPDGSTIAFVDLHDAGDDEIELLDIDSGERHPIASSSDTLGDPVWSPDGEQIAFWRSDGGIVRLFTVELASGDVAQLTSGYPDVFPAWSPDGSTIAFDRRNRLWVVDVASGEEHELLEAPAGVKHPFWGTNNGQFLYGVEEIGAGPGPTEQFRILMLDPQTGAPAGRSEVLDGLPSDAVYDDWGVHVAARTLPAGTTDVTTMGYDFSVLATNTVAGDITVLRTRPTPPQTPSGTTPDGRTYGGDRAGRQPDLIAVVLGRDDVAYVPRRDLNEPQPSSPDEAGAWQDRRNAARYPAYTRDGVTVAGAFDVGSSDNGPRLLTTSTVPPGTEQTSVTGVLEIDDEGCSYLNDGSTRYLLIWSWEIQLADSAGPPDTIENWLDDHPVAQAGETVTLDVHRLAGQAVKGGPCSTDEAPLYITP